MTQDRSQDDLHIVVGEEKRIADLLKEDEIIPLLGSVLQTGVRQARIVDEGGEILWSRGESSPPPMEEVAAPLKIEGEMVGKVVLVSSENGKAVAQSLAKVLGSIVNTIMLNNLKRLLTTEIHTSVVQQSYDELLESNRKLSISESRYRDLAKSLEKKVEERTSQLKKAQTIMFQQEKLAAVGQLAAGVAHEINNPLGFVTSNFNAISRYLVRIKDMLESLQNAFGNMKEGAMILAALEEQWKKLKLSYILEDMDDLLAQSHEGCERITKIVADLKGFSHIDEAELKAVAVNSEIDRTLNVLAHQLPADAEIVKKYQEVPDVLGNAALLCQVFFNIILNACQAKPKGLRLLIETSAKDGHLFIRFTDNGPGIPKEIQHRIFEPFFTTREVGAGSGMGLATSYEVIASYKGTLSISSEEGCGVAFTITLPLQEN